MVPRKKLRPVHAFLGCNWVLNGLWMMFEPVHWYGAMPQAVDTGPLNQHFLRDYGSVFFLIGLLTLSKLARGRFTRETHVWVLLFFVTHASLHVWDVLAGRLGHNHWTSGFPLVLLPVAVLAALWHPAAWEPGKAAGERKE
jgi:hypothetical protein